MATQITANLPTLDFPREVDYPTQEDWAAFSAAAELNFGILGGSWSAQMQLWKTEANAMSTELNNNANIAQAVANYQGDWTSKGYTLGQTVSVNKIYYICKLTHSTGQNPTTIDSTYWNLAIGNWYGNFGTGTQSFNGFGGSGFKNIVINGNKKVNQSGLTTTDNSYNYDNHYKVGSNWFQFIEGKNIVSGEPYTLSWEGIATASYYVGTAGSATINAQLFTAIANGETITPTITSSQFLWIKFASNTTGSTYNNVQFEPGMIPTPYEKRLYQSELNFVKRYVLPITVYWSGYVVAAARAGAQISFPVEMLTAPTMINYTTLVSNGFPSDIPTPLGLTQNSVTLDLISNSVQLDGRWSGSFTYVARP